MSTKRWENYAYILDDTADTSFKITTEGLKQNTIYQLTFLHHTPTDFKRTVYCMQGLINRDFGMDDQHTSLIYIMGSPQEKFWLDYCQSKDKSVFANMERVEVNNFNDFFQIFNAQYKQCGFVVWDNQVAATANAAIPPKVAIFIVSITRL